MPIVNTYRKDFTPEEQAECLEWFEQHFDHLPENLELQSMSMPNLKQTVRNMLIKLRTRMGNKTFFGEFAVLMEIRQRVEQQVIIT